jgi:hypothetical protein
MTAQDKLAYLMGAQSMNIEPATMTLIITGVATAIKSYKAWKAGQIAKAEAHRQFMNQVYSLPPGALRPDQTEAIFKAANVSLEMAATFLQKFVDENIAKITADAEAEAAKQAETLAKDAGLTNKQIDTSKDISRSIAAGMIKVGINPNPIVVADNAVMATVSGATPNQFANSSEGGITGWWNSLSTTGKALSVGSAAFIGYGIYREFFKPKKRGRK